MWVNVRVCVSVYVYELMKTRKILKVSGMEWKSENVDVEEEQQLLKWRSGVWEE